MNMSTTLETMPGAVEMSARHGAEYDEILTPDALRFIVLLHDKFEDRRRALMKARVKHQKELDCGIFPDFNPETEYIRTSRWQVAPVKPELQDRRIEITGSVDR
jgi:malate synthase